MPNSEAPILSTVTVNFFFFFRLYLDDNATLLPLTSPDPYGLTTILILLILFFLFLLFIYTLEQKGLLASHSHRLSRQRFHHRPSSRSPSNQFLLRWLFFFQSSRSLYPPHRSRWQAIDHTIPRQSGDNLQKEHGKDVTYRSETSRYPAITALDGLHLNSRRDSSIFEERNERHNCEL